MNDGRPDAEFKAVFTDTRWDDGLYKYLQNIDRLYPEDRFHTLIKDAASEFEDDEAIYRRVQRELPKIKPFMAQIRRGLPSLFKQKREMAQQTKRLLWPVNRLNGYVEIGSTGRYISELRKHIGISGPIYLVNEIAPTFWPGDIAERGGLRRIGRYLPLNNDEPLPAAIPDASVDLVTCYMGLHRIPLDRLDAFVRSIVRVLRPGAVFILREHDVTTPAMHTFVSLVHTVFNAGRHQSWDANRREGRHFRPIAGWVAYLGERGLRDKGLRELQANDPSDNVLLTFNKATA